MKRETHAIIEMLCCAVLWSIAGIFIKQIPWTGFAIASMRSLIAGTTIAVYMLFAKQRLAVNRRTLTSGLLTGCVYTCFVCANKLTTAANAIVLQFTAPVFIVVFSVLFLHERFRKADLLAVAATLGGVTLCFLDRMESGYFLGNCVAVASGMFMAAMFVTVGELEKGERFTAILIGQTVTFLIGLPSVILSRPVFTAGAVTCILILGVFQLGLAYILYVKSTEYCPPLACSLLGAVEPVLNPIWVMLFNGETPGAVALAGELVVIAAVSVWCVYDSRKEKAV